MAFAEKNSFCITFFHHRRSGAAEHIFLSTRSTTSEPLKTGVLDVQRLVFGPLIDTHFV
jgi:hypothetical protein